MRKGDKSRVLCKKNAHRGDGVDEDKEVINNDFVLVFVFLQFSARLDTAVPCSNKFYMHKY